MATWRTWTSQRMNCPCYRSDENLTLHLADQKSAAISHAAINEIGRRDFQTRTTISGTIATLRPEGSAADALSFRYCLPLLFNDLSPFAQLPAGGGETSEGTR